MYSIKKSNKINKKTKKTKKTKKNITKHFKGGGSFLTNVLNLSTDNKNDTQNKAKKETEKGAKVNLNVCAPNLNIDNENSKSNDFFTCFTRVALLNIITMWNKNNTKDKIIIKDSYNKEKLWKLIDSKLKNICDNEYCWTKQDFTKHKFNKYFKPKKPSKWNKNNNEWLNTQDIERVMKQYEQKYSNFYFIGAVPIDFDHEFSPGNCVINELCKINLKSVLNKNKTKIGIIFNLDKHDEDGSHWVSFFADFDSNNIYYFDSYGYKEPKEVTELMKRLKSQGEQLGKKINIHVNNVRHQYKNSECGVYSINFILSLLKGENYDSFSNNKIDDDTMWENRKIYFIDEDTI
jgi:hypothetical protein